MTCVAIGTGKYVEFLAGKKRRGLMHKVRVYAHFLSHVYKAREGIGRYKLKL